MSAIAPGLGGGGYKIHGVSFLDFFEFILVAAVTGGPKFLCPEWLLPSQMQLLLLHVVQIFMVSLDNIPAIQWLFLFFTVVFDMSSAYLQWMIYTGALDDSRLDVKGASGHRVDVIKLVCMVILPLVTSLRWVHRCDDLAHEESQRQRSEEQMYKREPGHSSIAPRGSGGFSATRRTYAHGVRPVVRTSSQVAHRGFR